jgi:hypothetical protein
MRRTPRVTRKAADVLLQARRKDLALAPQSSATTKAATPAAGEAGMRLGARGGVGVPLCGQAVARRLRAHLAQSEGLRDSDMCLGQQ